MLRVLVVEDEPSSLSDAMDAIARTGISAITSGVLIRSDTTSPVRYGNQTTVIDSGLEYQDVADALVAEVRRVRPDVIFMDLALNLGGKPPTYAVNWDGSRPPGNVLKSFEGVDLTREICRQVMVPNVVWYSNHIEDVLSYGPARAGAVLYALDPTQQQALPVLDLPRTILASKDPEFTCFGKVLESIVASARDLKDVGALQHLSARTVTEVLLELHREGRSGTLKDGVAHALKDLARNSRPNGAQVLCDWLREIACLPVEIPDIRRRPTLGMLADGYEKNILADCVGRLLSGESPLDGDGELTGDWVGRMDALQREISALFRPSLSETNSSVDAIVRSVPSAHNMQYPQNTDWSQRRPGPMEMRSILENALRNGVVNSGGQGCSLFRWTVDAPRGLFIVVYNDYRGAPPDWLTDTSTRLDQVGRGISSCARSVDEVNSQWDRYEEAIPGLQRTQRWGVLVKSLQHVKRHPIGFDVPLPQDAPTTGWIFGLFIPFRD